MPIPTRAATQRMAAAPQPRRAAFQQPRFEVEPGGAGSIGGGVLTTLRLIAYGAAMPQNEKRCR
jgi:hypothetical protein